MLAETVTGAPQLVLTVASHESDLLVLGSRGLGGFTGMLMGSIAAAMAHRASSPVVIVRGRANPTGPVVVGVDGSRADIAVLRAAFDRSRRLGVDLQVIHAWDAPSHLLPTPRWSGEAGLLERQAQTVLDHAIEPLAATYPDVSVDARLVTTSPTAALVRASAEASIVVVGSHGAGALRGLIAGSVCHGVMYHASCPVEVIRVADAIKEAAEEIRRRPAPRLDPRLA